MQFANSEEAAEALRLATEAADIGIWDYNLQTDELHWSDRCKAIFGVTQPGAVTLAVFNERLHPDELGRIRVAMETALNPEGTREFEADYRIYRPNQELRYVHAKGKAFFHLIDGQLKATRFIGTVLDRTNQRRAEIALVQAEQLAITGRLTASIAHEINNPLEAVTNILYLLRREIHSAEGQNYLHQAESELARVSEIATNTLRFQRDPAGPAEVAVPDLLRSVLALFQGRMSVRGVRLELDCVPALTVHADQGQLRQIVVNLVSNALDAMQHGGQLWVRCRPAHAARPGARISIADTGTGMAPEVQTRAFEPFYTTKGNNGTGLGLWLSREIARKQGYRLQVRSKLGAGTVFSLLIPGA